MHTGSVHEDNLRRRMDAFARGQFHHAFNAVAGGLGLGGDNGDLFTAEGVQERALAHVGPAEDGDESGFQRAWLLSECTASPG